MVVAVADGVADGVAAEVVNVAVAVVDVVVVVIDDVTAAIDNIANLADVAAVVVVDVIFAVAAVADVSAIAEELGAEIVDEIPLCAGGDGPMVLKTGTKEGKEYRGWVCATPKSGHPARWMRIGSDGKWTFQR